MSEIPSYELNDSTPMPSIGFGTYGLKGADGVQSIAHAIDAGYRLLDTAVNYENEDAVGRAVAASGVPRSELMVTTKIPGRHHGYEATMASFRQSQKALGLDVVDLYLIHWPMSRLDQYVGSFKAMLRLREDGLVRSAGVSNFTEEFLTRLHDETGEWPAVNQVELHPYFPQAELRAFHTVHGIRTESWTPLGRARTLFTEAPVVVAAAAHHVAPAQVVLRWHVQLGAVPIPKSADPLRQQQNLDVFGFALGDDEMSAITALGRPDGRLWGADPNTNEEM